MSGNNKTAAQRIEELEKAMASAYQAVSSMASEVQMLKDALRLLGNKTDAVVKLISGGNTLTEESVSAAMINNNVEELTKKVTNLVNQGILKSEESVTAGSFVVGREKNDGGETINPRLQFTVASLTKELQEKLVGAKSGDILTLEEGKLKFEVLESYEIIDPTAKPAGQTVSAPEAPTAESSSPSDSQPEASPAISA